MTRSHPSRRHGQPIRILIPLLLSIAIFGGHSTPAAAESYWGALPAAADSSDSSRAVFHDPPMPVGEAVFYWPVRVVTFPLALLAGGLGEAVEYLDEQRVIHRVSSLLAPRRGPFGVVLGVQAGGLSGFGAGISIEHDDFFGHHRELRLRGATTVNGDNRVSLGVRAPLGEGEYYEYGVGYRSRPNARYFGIGPESSVDDESFYGQETFWTGAGLRKRVGGGVFGEANLLYSSIGAGEPREDVTPSITKVFAGNLPFGYGGHSYGVSLGLQLSHENDLGATRPVRGGSRRVRVERFEGTDKQGVGFWSYRAELQQFLTLWHPYRVLAIRGYGSWLDPMGADVIPFQRLMINDSPDALRGYQSFRFRDRGMVALNAEYRFPILTNKRPGGSGLDLYPLADWGQVFDAAGRVGFRNMTFSYGLGFRVESTRGFVARVEWSRSDEENTFRLRTEQIFQFMRLGVLYGRDPVPAR